MTKKKQIKLIKFNKVLTKIIVFYFKLNNF